MGKVITLMVIGVFLAVGCASPKVNRFETTTYQSASPENKLKIEQGIMGVGMSIEECRLSCPECQFVRKFVSSANNYELWELKDSREGRDLYLHVVNGRIEKVSAETQKPTEKKINVKKK